MLMDLLGECQLLWHSSSDYLYIPYASVEFLEDDAAKEAVTIQAYPMESDA